MRSMFRQTIKAHTGQDFPMKFGDRLFIHYPDGAMARLKVVDVMDLEKRGKDSILEVETVKTPTRKHASSNAMRFGGQ